MHKRKSTLVYCISFICACFGGVNRGSLHYNEYIRGGVCSYVCVSGQILFCGRTVHVDADLYKRRGTRACLFASFGCSSENGSDS